MTATLSYNAQGQRASYSVTVGSTPYYAAQFSYRAGELGQAVIVSGTQSYTDTYLYTPTGAPLELIRQSASGGTLTTARYWYEEDGRGNVVALTDITGTVVDRYSYDAWGTLTSASEQVPQRLRYAGYWYDQEFGWYWVSIRYYDPPLGRWLQPDPSQQDGVRTYVYVGDDPVDATDPSGLSGNSSDDACNVWIIGFFCGRNQAERARQERQALIDSVQGVGIIWIGRRAAAPNYIRNGTKNAKGDYAESEVIRWLEDRTMGYKYLGGHSEALGLNRSQGLDAVMEKEIPTYANRFLPKYIIVEVKYTGVNPNKVQVSNIGLDDLQQGTVRYIDERLDAAVEPNIAATIRAELYAGRVGSYVIGFSPSGRILMLEAPGEEVPIEIAGDR